jgi:prolyl oligopeptidase
MCTTGTRAVAGVLPQSEDALQDASFIGGRFVLHYLHDAACAARVHERDGRVVREVNLPASAASKD